MSEIVGVGVGVDVSETVGVGVDVAVSEIVGVGVGEPDGDAPEV